MKTDEIIWRLACLASFPYQERYVLGGTVDEYVIPHELIEDVDSLRFRLFRTEHQSLLSSGQMSILIDLLEAIKNVSVEELGLSPTVSESNFTALFQNGEGWNLLRSKAAASLASFGYDIESMSVEDVERLGG